MSLNWCCSWKSVNGERQNGNGIQIELKLSVLLWYQRTIKRNLKGTHLQSVVQWITKCLPFGLVCVWYRIRNSIYFRCVLSLFMSLRYNFAGTAAVAAVAVVDIGLFQTNTQTLVWLRTILRHFLFISIFAFCILSLKICVLFHSFAHKMPCDKKKNFCRHTWL